MPALATSLSRVGGGDQRHLPASAFSLAQQMIAKITPARIQDALGEVALRHAVNQQILYSDTPETADQRTDQRVEEVLPLVGHVFREATQDRDGLATVRSALLLAGDGVLQDAEFPLR